MDALDGVLADAFEAPPLSRRRAPVWRLLTAGACLILACIGCDSHEAEIVPDEMPSVSVRPPIRREVTDWDEFTGRIASTEHVELRAR
jgi:multidrug efflux system membrane fusion protein